MTAVSTEAADKKVIGQVLTFNPATNKNEFLGYTEKSIHTKHGKMYHVVTKLGFEITATDDHSLATNGKQSFFDPIPPQDSLGKFLPIAYKIEYDVPHDTERRALDAAIDDIVHKKSSRFQQYMLALQPDFLIPLIIGLMADDKDGKMVYKCKDKDELELAKIVLARCGFLLKLDLENLQITVLDKTAKQIPQGDKLVLEAEARYSNPYKQLPYTWDEVVSVEEVERDEKTYDFSVPDFPLFIANGILVYDTMQLHVPATEGARQEALDKMLPSKNLFSPRTMSPMMLPQQEHIFGLFLSSKNIPDFTSSTKFQRVNDAQTVLTAINMGSMKPDTPVEFKGFKTTAGLVVANEAIPMQYRVYNKTWNKKVVTSILTMIGKNRSDEYAHCADHIKEIGSLLAYKMGASYKKTDFNLKETKQLRDAYFKKVDKQLAAIEAGAGTKKEKEEKKVQVLQGAQAFAQDLTAKATANTFNQLAYSGSKGSPSQVMQIMVSPTVVADPKDRLIPMLIHKSYLEGLSPADYFVSSYGTRKGTVGAKLSVAPAGALAKEIVGNSLDMVISTKDCHTIRGITRNIDDTENIINRVEASTNKFIDANYYELLKRQGKRQVIVRSPATCECRDGICQYCYGYNEKLKFPDIGENVGAYSAMAITEPLTQLGLSSKHSAGTAQGEAVGFNTIKSFFNMSTKFSGAAVISEVSGNITKIEPSPSGGTNVFVDRKKYYIPPTRRLKVTIGQHVSAGDALTDGVINVSKVVPYKGIDQGRVSFINNVSNLYDGAGQHSLKKNFEVISRGLINYVQIDDPGDFDDLVIGDIVEYNQLIADIRMNPAKRAPKYTPVQKGTNKAPTYKKDWLANFGFKYLKGELVENAAVNAKSSLHSYHPIGAYARGVEFGRGQNGQY